MKPQGKLAAGLTLFYDDEGPGRAPDDRRACATAAAASRPLNRGTQSEWNPGVRGVTVSAAFFHASGADTGHMTETRGTSLNDVGVVAIGRNEDQRLVRCLESMPRTIRKAVYVDSGSTDASVANARARGVEVVELDMSRPFTAARARNEGFERLMQLHPDLALVQFVDGDCEIRARLHRGGCGHHAGRDRRGGGLRLAAGAPPGAQPLQHSVRRRVADGPAGGDPQLRRGRAGAGVGAAGGGRVQPRGDRRRGRRAGGAAAARGRAPAAHRPGVHPPRRRHDPAGSVVAAGQALRPRLRPGVGPARGAPRPLLRAARPSAP